MELVRAVKDDFSLGKLDFFVVPSDFDSSFVYVDHFPKIVAFAVEYEVFVEFVVVNSYDFGNVDQAL